MISKNQIKFIRSLELKKNRQRERLFVAEGPKVVGDLMEMMRPAAVYATAEWVAQHAGALTCEAAEISDDELRKVSFLQHPQQVVALFPMFDGVGDADCGGDLSLALDGVQDPGNLGTIIRVADWFGVRRIFCSRDTADVYNPKVVQATMGSIARVGVQYVDLPAMLEQLPDGVPVYGTFLDGEDIYASELFGNGIIVMGNEGKGISAGVARHINRRLLIPNYPKDRDTADSLNVAIATAVTCAEFRRRG